MDKVEPRLIVQYGNDKNQNLRLDWDWFHRNSRSMTDVSIRAIEPVFASATGLSIDEMVQRWEKVSLITEAKSSVISALQIIAPDIENLDIIGRGNLANGRMVRYTPVVMAKLVGVTNPVPLRSLGEGMMRVFGLALALVTAQNTMLLIDEIDSGLHHSVQIEVWRLIFGVAERLNVQVFATTHSWDCVATFQQIADEDAQQIGMLIRLQRETDEVVPVLIDEETLAIVTRELIEIR